MQTGSFAHGQVFTTVGFTGMILSIDILTADTSHLRNRGLAYAYTSSPYIITTFAGPKIAEHFHETNWRWAFATVCFMLPVIAIPMFLLLQKAKRTAIAQGKLELKERTMSPLSAVWYYIVEFDRMWSLTGCAIIPVQLMVLIVQCSACSCLRAG